MLESPPYARKSKGKVDKEEERLIAEAIEEANKERERLEAEAMRPTTEEQKAQWLKEEVEDEKRSLEVSAVLSIITYC